MHAASSEPATTALSAPQFTPRELYEGLDDVLSESAAGTVYSLKDYPSLAVKVIQLSGLDKDSVDAAKAKLTVLLTLSYIGVLKHYQVIEYKGLIYVVTDRYNKTLEHLLAEHKRRKIPVPIAMILSVLRQVAAALAYLHSVNGANTRGLVHCDLRPANVLISADGERFVIADFGLCKDALWSGSTLIGIMAYVAPEVLLRNDTSPASDVWSLGVIIYELVTLRRPNFLGGKEPAEVFVDEWTPDLSGVADGFIKNVLERIFVLEPKERLTARELHETLTAADIPVGELGHWYMALEDKCSALETALNSTNARITALEAALENRLSGADALGQGPRLKTARIDVLEYQCKKHLAMIKALENRFTKFSSEMNRADSQTNLSTLPQLIYAAHTNDMETIRILANDEDCIGQRDEQKMTALMHAAQQGHIGPVKLLVEKEKGLKDNNGWTALMHAAHCNHSEIVEILAPYEHGRRNNNNRTALMIIAEEGHAEAASVLVPYERDLIDSEGNTALMIAGEARHEIVANILESTDKLGRTRLMRAAIRGCIETAKLVIKYDGGAQDIFGVTALMIAASVGNVEIVKLLVGLEGGMRDGSETTALMNAASAGNVEIVKLLVDLEGGVKNMEEMTALECGAVNGHLEVVKLLFEKEGHLIDKSDESFFGELENDGYSEIASFLRNSRTPGADDCNDHQAAPRSHE
ncbi:Kinase, NEK [Giardia duodenalis]|uniref:Kinase, NEK n=1 Tax=Giardia intestinalis (strain ATCC 50803 / WB clone C6) TaxID=184922 RepID=A8B9W0_GIAIC|nr:Kinase, NEK [Giardia intestinalis]KAE8306053.1 Kinase, NEK [Giardia intestinalis]|eukprot:XP_001708578.1 Kinase, NEK [Giardia lamblia ATCC 50803]